MCNRDNIHLLGEPVLAPIMNVRFTADTIVERMKLTERYIERELPSAPNKKHFVGYILKCFGFSMEMATGLSVRCADADEVLALLDTWPDAPLVLRETIEAAKNDAVRGNPAAMLRQLSRFNSVLADNLERKRQFKPPAWMRPSSNT
jgi:hypothetical protein